MSLTNPIQSTLISLIAEHKVVIEVIPDFYLHTFPYLLGRESLVLEAFPADLSIKLLDLFVLEQAKYFQATKNLSLVFFGENSRTVSKISSLNPPALTPLIPGSPVIELTVHDLELLLGASSRRHISKFKDFSVTLVLFLVAETISDFIFPPDWQTIVIPLDRFEGPSKNVSINFLKITRSDDGMKIERLQSELPNQPINGVTRYSPLSSTEAVNVAEKDTLKSAQLMCRDHGFAVDINDVLLPSIIYTLLGENVILHTYSDMNFIHLVAILAFENELGQINIGDLYICINSTEDREELSSFMPYLEFNTFSVSEEIKEGSPKNFLITSNDLNSLKLSKNIHGIIALLSSVPNELTEALASIPTGYTLLLGTSCYSSDLIKIMHKSRFILLSGYPIRPISCVGYKSEEYHLVNLSSLPSIARMRPTPLHKSKKKSKSKSKVKSKIDQIPLLPMENPLLLEEHANFLLASLLQSNCNIVVKLISSFDPQTYVSHLLTTVDLKSKSLQAIVHGDIPSINILFEKFAIANIHINFVAFYFAGGDPSSLKALLITDNIQILFIPTKELLTANNSLVSTIKCKLLLGVYIGNTSQPIPLESISPLHSQAALHTQVVVVVRDQSEIDSNTELVPRPFYLVEESSDLEKERFFVTYCNYSLRFDCSNHL